MNSLDTNFNVPPYFDDYDEDKQYYRILFRPSVAVQARELTQSQTITQEQIRKFGNTWYKDGTVIDGVGITYYPNTHYISAVNQFNSNVELLATAIDNTYLVTNSQDSTTAVRAKVLISKNGNDLSAPETNRFYVKYVSTGKDSANSDIKQFSPGDTLYFYNSNQTELGVLDANNVFDSIETLPSNSTFESTGYAYCVGVTDGTVYQKGFFQKVSPQIITVRDFTTNVSGYVVGFDTVEEIINENIDTSLADNALGYSNENAPGAHRLKLTPVLISKLKSEVSSNNINFTSIIEFDNNQPVQQETDPQLAAIEEQISTRTYEESGDYVVKPFKVEAIANTSNSEVFDYSISSGIGYVRGRRVEKVGTSLGTVQRATSTNYRQNEIITSNYGNYVICDELVGAFDVENLQELTIYDSPQDSISEIEGSTSAPTGNAIGKANVRAVVHRTGERGNASTQYKVYIFNIEMNTGKSFSADAKSFYSDGDFGEVKADIVLENNKAVIKDSGNSKLFFNTGMKAIKKLAGNTGINDTVYTYNQIKSGSMNSSGIINITIDTAAPGASTERIYSTIEDDYRLFVSSNTYTANLAGTIEIESSNVSVYGSGTNFTTDFSAGDNIRIFANSSTTVLRNIVSVSNNTFMTVNAPFASSNTTSNYQKYYVSGSHIPIDTVTVNSNTTFTIDTGLTVSSSTPQNVYISYPVLRNQAAPVKKVVKKNRFVKINCSTNPGGANGPWDLGLVDVSRIRNIYVGTTYSESNSDRTSWFILDNGQNDNYYDHAKLSLKPQYKDNVTSSSRILVELDFFEANTNSSVGFYSVESYPVNDSVDANSNTTIKTIEIPYYNGVNLRDVIDFRPRKYNTANTEATLVAGATEDPSSSNSSFDVAVGGQYHISPDTNFIADFEYYLPRYDIITLEPNGNYNIVPGVPSETPRVPSIESDQLMLSKSFIPPYPSATKNETLVYDNPNIPYIKTTLKNNKRYTMQDIGKIIKRIDKLEYYTVLNSLEQNTKSLTITDENGLDRFKNGIFADPLNNHNIGSVSDIEYKIAIDSSKSLARPFFQKHDVDFEFDSDSSSNVKRTSKSVILDHVSQVYIDQKYATKTRNLSQDIWEWRGNLTLYPSFDYYRDETISPPTNVTLDYTVPWDNFANSPYGTHWGEWETISTNVSTDVETSEAENTGGDGKLYSTSTDTTTTTTTTTETLQQITGYGITVNSETESYDTGNYITNFTINPYMRSRLVAFISNNVKPNTLVYPFFDNVNVSEHCAPGEITGSEILLKDYEAGKEDKIVQRIGRWGEPLRSNSKGSVIGVFRIPANTFRVGEREFVLADVPDLGISQPITISKANYVAENISVTKGSTTLTAIQPEIMVEELTETRTLTDVDVDVETTSVIVSSPPSTPGYWTGGNDEDSGWVDHYTDAFGNNVDAFYDEHGNNIATSVNGSFVDDNDKESVASVASSGDTKGGNKPYSK